MMFKKTIISEMMENSEIIVMNYSSFFFCIIIRYISILNFILFSS